MDDARNDSAYDTLPRPQQKALVDWAVRQVKNPDSIYYQTSFSQLCETVAADKAAMRAITRGVEPTLRDAPRKDSGFAEHFIRTTVDQTTTEFLESLLRGEVPGVTDKGTMR